MTDSTTTRAPHPAIQMLLTEFEEADTPAMHTVPVEEARSLFEELFSDSNSTESVGSIQNITIGGPQGEIPLRIYHPDTDGRSPVFVYFHGGGWVLGSLDTHDTMCKVLTNASDCVIVSVDYRRAPENPFPAALEDCYAATRWVRQNPDDVSGDTSQLAVGGPSAGGNLAAAVTQLARDRDGPEIDYQVLLYPVTNYAFDTKSYRDNAEGYLLTKAGMEWYWKHYLPHGLAGKNTYASPLQARTLTELPPATVVTCGFDPLRDEGDAYARRLENAGVEVTHRQYAEMIHGFMGMLSDPDLAPARDAIAQIGDDLQRVF